jgi:hypothetical protein
MVHAFQTALSQHPVGAGSEFAVPEVQQLDRSSKPLPVLSVNHIDSNSRTSLASYVRLNDGFLLSSRLSQRTTDSAPTSFREILAVAAQPGIISFAGGLPAADSCPEFALPAVAETDWRQYGASEGKPALREAVAAMLAARGLRVTPAQVRIPSGSQQGFDLVAKFWLVPGTIDCRGRVAGPPRRAAGLPLLRCAPASLTGLIAAG